MYRNRERERKGGAKTEVKREKQRSVNERETEREWDGDRYNEGVNKVRHNMRIKKRDSGVKPRGEQDRE